MILGFTGTQQGMTSRQRETLIPIIESYRLSLTAFHHGCCKGADTQAHYLIEDRFIDLDIHRHWPLDNSKVTACRVVRNRAIDHAPRAYLSRNMDIVQACERLIATPKEFTEVLRSGTWSTCRYASHRNVPVTVIWPDGKVDLCWEHDRDL